MKKLVKLVNIGNSARLERGRAAQMSIGKNAQKILKNSLNYTKMLEKFSFSSIFFKFLAFFSVSGSTQTAHRHL